MNLNTLFNTSKFDGIFQNNNWQNADYYDFSTNNLFWNKSALITLSKKYTVNKNEAILYLLQK